MTNSITEIPDVGEQLLEQWVTVHFLQGSAYRGGETVVHAAFLLIIA